VEEPGRGNGTEGDPREMTYEEEGSKTRENFTGDKRRDQTERAKGNLCEGGGPQIVERTKALTKSQEKREVHPRRKKT